MINTSNYPKIVMPYEVVNGDFATGLFRIYRGKAFYDQVFLRDGGRAFYLIRIEPTEDNKLKVIKRWIPHNTKLEQMFNV